MIKPADKKKTFYIICILLAVVTFVVYREVLCNDFTHYDDNSYITENQNIQSGLTVNSIRWAFTSSYMANWHPLTWVSHMLDYDLFGPKPWGHHLVNLLLHIANVLLLFLVFKMMTGSIWPSVFVAAVFAVHPLHVESVAWAAERKDVLSTMFWMLTMIGYVFYVRKQGKGLYFLALILFVLGLMAKPMLVTLPVILLLMDYWPLIRFDGVFTDKKRFFKLILEKLPFFAMSLISGIITIIAQRSGGAIAESDVFPLSYRLENAVVSYGRYIVKTFWPGKLSVLYLLRPNNLTFVKITMAALALTAIFVFVVKLSKKHRYLLTGWLWYIVTLLPVIGLIQVGIQSSADRYTYIPSIGLFVIVAFGATELSGKWASSKIALGILSGLVIFSLSVISYYQVKVWQNDITLFEHATSVTRDNFIGYTNLGASYCRAGRYDEAVEVCKKSVKILPTNYLAYPVLYSSYNALGRYDEAIESCKQAVKILPTYQSYNNLGVTYTKVGRNEEAIKAFEQAAKIEPTYNAYFNLGAAYLKTSRYVEAIEAYKKAVKIKPDHTDSLYNLGLAYGNIGSYEDAINCFLKLIKIKPNNAEAYYNLGFAYHKINNYQKEVEAYRKAIQIKPDFAEAHYRLALTLIQRGDKTAAMEECNILKKLNPEMAEKLIAEIGSK